MLAAGNAKRTPTWRAVMKPCRTCGKPTSDSRCWELRIDFDQLVAEKIGTLLDLLRRAAGYLDSHCDSGPLEEGWQSEELRKLCAEIDEAIK
jgi:hypothetical protein